MTQHRTLYAVLAGLAFAVVVIATPLRSTATRNPPTLVLGTLEPTATATLSAVTPVSTVVFATKTPVLTEAPIELTVVFPTPER